MWKRNVGPGAGESVARFGTGAGSDRSIVSGTDREDDFVVPDAIFFAVHEFGPSL